MLFFLNMSSARVYTHPTTDRFESYIDFNVSGITTPKVVEFQTRQSFGDFVALKKMSSNDFVLVQTRVKAIENPWNLSIESSSRLMEGNLRALQDQDRGSFVNFETAGSFNKSILFNNPANHKISELHVNLENNSNTPRSVTIEAKLRGSEDWQMILNEQPYSSV